MSRQAELWELEKGFWLEGPPFYREHMAPDAVMVFPARAGILTAERILDGLTRAPRWQSVEFAEASLARLGNAIVLAYRAEGRRDGAQPYRALCCSTYAEDGGKLLAHQQAPLA